MRGSNAGRLNLTAVFMVFALGMVLSASAVTKTWTGGTGLWNDGANWDGEAPQSGDDVVITNAGASVVLTESTPTLGSLTLSRTLTITNWTTCLSAADVTVQSGGIITLPGSFTDSQPSNRVWIVCTNLMIESNGAIEVDGKGYAGARATSGTGYGPGGGSGSSYGGGGGYGGRGNWGWMNRWEARGGATYGSAEFPSNPGSGGGTFKSGAVRGGDGGGVIWIAASGDVVVNGVISANGGNNASYYSGGGSGGSVWIQCDRFGGTGEITATGSMPANYGGAGGGGRIALDYAELIGTPVVRLEAACPQVGPAREHPWVRWNDFYWSGELGTLFLPDSALLTQPITGIRAHVVLEISSSWMPSSLSVSGTDLKLGPAFQLMVDGDLSVDAGGSLEMAEGSTVRCGGSLNLDDGQLFMHATTQLVCSTAMVLTNGGFLYVSSAATNGSTAYGAVVEVGGDIHVAPNSWVYPNNHISNGGAVRFRVENLHVASGGGFNADGRGYGGGLAAAGQRDGFGPGHGLGSNSSGTYSSGAGYGGQGGWSWYNNKWGLAGGGTYGSSNAPVAPGSGGGAFSSGIGGHGGGTVWIDASGEVVFNGTITSGGGANTYYSGGGAGGGIFIAADSFSGRSGALLSADGGDRANSGGPGGGGRIAVALGLSAAAREALVANGTLPGLYVYDSHADYQGALSVGVGEGPDYTGEQWRAPQPGSAWFVTTNVSLTVKGSPGNYGSPAPQGYGTTTDLAPGSTVTNTVESPADEAAGLRRASLGWNLTDATGASVDSGVSNQAVFTLNATRELTWRWTNEYLLAVSSGSSSNGSVRTDANGWYTNGSWVAGLWAVASNGYMFSEWTGDVPAGHETDNPLSVIMDHPRTIVGQFASVSGMERTWNGTGTWDTVANWSPVGMPGAYDHAVIGSGFAVVGQPRSCHQITVDNGATLMFTNWTASLTASNLTVLSGGRIGLPPAFSAAQMSNRVWIVCTNLMIASGGEIDATGKGFAGGYNGSSGEGPGGGAGNAHGGGGGYGGRGGWGGGAGGWGYGIPPAPLTPGSGGGSFPQAISSGGAGGGAVLIEASGDVTVDGSIVANGTDATYYAGGGSGGGISIVCDRFGGVGAIRANGGKLANSGGGGGGGRISLDYRMPLGAPSVRIEAREAVSQVPLWDYRLRWSAYNWTAEPGSIHLPDTSLLSETMTNLHGRVTIDGVEAWSPASLTVSNGLVGFGPGFRLEIAGDLTVGPGGALELHDRFFLSCGGKVLLDGGRLVMNVFTQMTCGADLELKNGGAFHAISAPTNGSAAYGASVDVAGEITVGTDSWFIPEADMTNGGVVRIRCDSVSVASGGGIDAKGRGFGGGWRSVRATGYGPGAAGSSFYGSGAGHGGKGGDSYYGDWGSPGGPAYGSSNAPVLAGSGGSCHSSGYGGHGGGVIWIEARRSVDIDGTLNADSGEPSTASGGGSGGGIFVSTPEFSCTGVLSAKGGRGVIHGDNSGGPGGGGRIAILLGFDAGVREALIAGESARVQYLAALPDYGGECTVAIGLDGPDYTEAEWRAPESGTVTLMWPGPLGTLLILR